MLVGKLNMAKVLHNNFPSRLPHAEEVSSQLFVVVLNVGP